MPFSLPPRTLVVCLLLLCAVATPLLAQEPEGEATGRPNGAPRVFLDCDRRCFFDFIRQQVAYINWVRDRRDAQIHILVTRQRTGSGLEYQFDYIGQEEFVGQDQRLLFSSSSTDTDDERRRGFTRTLMLGLARYIAQTPLAANAELVISRPEGDEAPASAASLESDPWDFWVFRVGLDAVASGEQRRDERRISAEVTANRTTENWKLRFEAENDYLERDFQFDDGSEFKDVTRNLEIGGQVIKTIGERWGAGVGGAIKRSTFFNLDPSYRAAGAIEYNFYPYTESSQRRLTATYFLGGTKYNYSEETIFEVEKDNLIDQGLLVSLDLEQPWGSASFDLEAMHFLQHPSDFNLELGGRFEYRIVRGLSLNTFVSIESIRSQRFLPRRGATDEEVLLEQRALETDFRFRIGLGISYTFGSIFNNVVNARLSGRSNGFHEIF